MKKAKNAKYIPLETDEVLQKMGKRIRELRIKKGFTNMDIFAYEHGFARAQYGRYENGEDLRFSTLLRLINAFEMSLEEFFSAGF
jgi:transcriptional regulator with XRE-family HTH domain